MKMNKYECYCEDNNCRLEAYNRPIFCPYYRNTRSDWRVIDEVHGLENIKDEIPNSGNADVEVPNSGNEVVEVKELWKPKVGESYWIIELYPIKAVNQITSDGFNKDEYLYKIGNCFKTREEAERALEKVKETLLKCQEEQSNG
jgi:hypothetical protein